MLEGFTRREIRTSGATIVTVQGGKGPPLLLLHGFSETHVMWHRVAPQLADRFTLIIPSDQTKRPCHIVWRRERRIGLAFD